MVRLFKKLFELLEIDIPIQEIKGETEYYEQSPHLHFISDSLIKWNIRSMIVKLDLRRENRIPLPAIIIKKENIFEIDIITKFHNDTVEIFESKNNNSKKLNLTNFYDVYSDEILLLEKLDLKYSSPKSLFHLKYYFLVGILLTLMIFIIFLSSKKVFIENFVFFIIKILSLSLLFSYFFKENGHKNRIYDFVCRNINGCIANSENNIFYHYTFAELGIIFFLTSSLSLVFNSNLSYISAADFYSHLLGLFFILYSLYFQLFVFKKVCKMCLIIIFSFLIDFLLTYTKLIDYNLKINILFVLTFVIVVLFVEYFRQGVNAEKKLKFADSVNKKLWRNKKIFKNILDISSNFKFDKGSSYSFGNINSNNEILIVITPSCKYCIEVFEEIRNLINLNPNYKLHVFINSVNTRNLQLFARASLNNDWVKASYLLHNWRVGLFDKDSIENEKDILIINNLIKNQKFFFEINLFDSYPNIYFNSKKIPQFIDFENIKISLSKFD
jgi:hypothetical protein